MRGATARVSTDPLSPPPRLCQDAVRIKTSGPSPADVAAVRLIPVRDRAIGGRGKADALNVKAAPWRWVPPTVAGAAFVGAEPRWAALPETSAVHLLRLIRERDWTSAAYAGDGAPPLKLSFFRDTGQGAAPAWPGYRALVSVATDSDGTSYGPEHWVDLPRPGPPTHAADHLAGGTHGGHHRSKRAAPPPGRPGDVGHNQVFDALFKAYEQRLPDAALEQLAVEGWADRTAHEYDCPADSLLHVSHVLTPTRAAPLRVLADSAPVAVAIFFSLGFLGAALALGIFRRRTGMPTDIQEAIEFAQSKGKARKEGTTGVTFAMVAGADATLDEVRFVVDFLKDPTAYAAQGAVPPKGILLEGGPGTGKTLIAKAVAGEAGVPFYQMSGSEFVEAIVGVGAARVRDLFKRARVQGEPCIIFVDEIDAVGVRRAEGGRRASEEREQTLNQLLSELDGFTPGCGVVFFAATNRSDLLDPALLRPGRFDRRIEVGLPDARGRLAVLKVHAATRAIAPSVDLQQLALDTPGLSGAELANVLNEAALAACRRQAAAVEQGDVDTALDRILFGLKRPPLPARLPTRASMAAHEAGIGVVSEALRREAAAAGATPRVEAVERVSIVPRGDSWSRTVLARRGEDAYFAVTRGRVRDRLAVLVAGHAAEAELGGATGPSTYAQKTGALAKAGALAEKAAGEYGLGDPKKPPPSYAAAAPGGPAAVVASKYQVAAASLDTDAFGGAPPRGAGFQPGDAAGDAARLEAWGLVRAAYARARALVRAHAAAVAAVRDALLADGDVSGDELRAMMDAHPPRAPRGGGAARAARAARAFGGGADT